MKALLRIAALLSFAFCFAGGVSLLKYSDAAPAGLFIIGLAIFFGAILFVAGERFGRKLEGR